MNRVVYAFVGLIATLIGLILTPGLGSSALAATVQGYAYDSYHDGAASTHIAGVRGPSGTYDRDSAYSAVDRWSRGASASLDVAAALTTISYDHPAPLASQVANETGTTQAPAQVAGGGSDVSDSGGVAAEAAAGDHIVLGLRAHGLEGTAA